MTLTEAQIAVKANLQICPVYPHSEFFRAMPFAPKAVEAVRELIGDPVRLRLDQVLNDAAAASAGTRLRRETTSLFSGTGATGRVKEYRVQVAGSWNDQVARLTASQAVGLVGTAGPAFKCRADLPATVG